jgi:N-methylhydantoinase A/oxoprolinase/acetone carboxylase beta subunit
MIIGLDVGGTHTDVVLLSADGLVNETKVPTDSANLFNTVLTGLDKVMAGIRPDTIERVVLSTTLTTNAIVQQHMPVVGMIVTGGPGIDPDLFRTNRFYNIVSGAIDHRGREIAPVHPEEVKQVAAAFAKEGIRQVGIVGKFSTRNPIHELKIQELLQGTVDVVFLGHRTSGSLNFPRRIATTYLNAAVYPIHKRFYEAVEHSLKAKGLDLPIRILKADGGNMQLQASLQAPAQTILSGPAASVMGALAYASKEVASLVLDVGGTTTDMAILLDGVPLLDPVGVEIGGYQTLIRSLDTQSLGVGGDSSIRVQNGKIEIGPERLGPAMAFGGPVPTPTDALIVLNQMSTGDRSAAADGLKTIAGHLGLTVEKAAAHIFDLVCHKILDAAHKMIDRINSKPVYTVHELMEGVRVKPKEILILGGPAPCFADWFAKNSGYRTRTVPRWTVANAIGAGLARTTCEVSLYADTEQKLATAPEEKYAMAIDATFDREQAVAKAFALLKEKALLKGANAQHLDMEVIEALQFNMVRGFYTVGKNIRIKVQVKPGLINGYEKIIRNL